MAVQVAVQVAVQYRPLTCGMRGMLPKPNCPPLFWAARRPPGPGSTPPCLIAPVCGRGEGNGWKQLVHRGRQAGCLPLGPRG